MIQEFSTPLSAQAAYFYGVCAETSAATVLLFFVQFFDLPFLEGLHNPPPNPPSWILDNHYSTPKEITGNTPKNSSAKYGKL